MLATLHIRHLLLIERLDLDFDAGLNMISGESGAGKSLILHAIALLLGARFDHSLLQSGTKQASVTGIWHFPVDSRLYGRLQDLGIAVDPEEGVIVRRVLGQASAVYINDTLIGLRVLSELAADFAEMYGQFAAHRLAESDYARILLDDYAGLSAELAQSAGYYAVWREKLRALQEAEARHEMLRQQAGYLDYALEELRELDLATGEVEELQEQRRTVRGAHARGARLEEARSLMSEMSDQGLLHQIDRLQSILGGGDDPRLSELIDGLERARIELGEVERTLGGLVVWDGEGEGDLEAIEARLFRMSELARKHGVTSEGLLRVREELEGQVVELEELTLRKHDLSVALDGARCLMDEVHERLSAARCRAAQDFAATVNKELLNLNMAQTTLAVELNVLEEPGEHGCERVQLLIRTQPDAPMRPLLKVVSGGELSRVLLATALCLGHGGGHGMLAGCLPLMFDEIDAGMGGETAALLGQRMKSLAASRQVVAVTHSPQVAARAERHFGVLKTLEEARVRTEVTALHGQARREEIARMLAGETVTSAARAAAEALLVEGGSMQEAL